MTDTILFVFEGAKTEGNVLDSLKQHFLNDGAHICVTFNTHIYTLYNEVKGDDFLDIVEVLREKEWNENDLKDVKRDDVSQVFLFFDYDGHVPGASNEKLLELLRYFNEETDMGKLYVSYPMVEALKHLNREVSFYSVCVDIDKNAKYKRLAHENCNVVSSAYAQLTEKHWKYIISEHCKKLNYLILGSFDLPIEYFSQEVILNHQLEKHIMPNNQVAVLSAFPVFIADYYGVSMLERIVS